MVGWSVFLRKPNLQRADTFYQGTKILFYRQTDRDTERQRDRQRDIERAVFSCLNEGICVFTSFHRKGMCCLKSRRQQENSS